VFQNGQTANDVGATPAAKTVNLTPPPELAVSSVTATLHIPGVNHKVRVVIIWDKKRDKEPCKILVTNRVAW
jgi:hypothetical protein